MITITTPLLVTGRGPAALVAAKLVAHRRVPCLLAGHEPIPDEEPVALDGPALDVLTGNGLLDVLRPFAVAEAPFTIVPLVFEQVLKHHCVVDLLVTVYDRMTFHPAPARPAPGDPVRGVLGDGRSEWAVEAQHHVHAAPETGIEAGLDGDIVSGAALAASVVG